MENGNNWDDDCDKIAIQNGSLNVLKWMYDLFQKEQKEYKRRQYNKYVDQTKYTFEEFILNDDNDYEEYYIYGGIKRAFKYGHLHIIKWLISIGYNYDNECIEIAKKKNHKDILEFINHL